MGAAEGGTSDPNPNEPSTERERLRYELDEQIIRLASALTFYQVSQEVGRSGTMSRSEHATRLLAQATVLQIRLANAILSGGFKLVAPVLPVFGLTAIALLGFPPIGRWVARHEFVHSLDKVWLEYLQLLLDLTTALAVGSAAYATHIRKRVEARVQKEAEELLTRSRTEVDALEAGITSILGDFRQAAEGLDFKTWDQRAVIIPVAIVQASSRVYGPLPNHFARLFLAQAMVDFPGGLYGLIAYLLLATVALVKVLKIWLLLVPPS